MEKKCAANECVANVFAMKNRLHSCLLCQNIFVINRVICHSEIILFAQRKQIGC